MLKRFYLSQLRSPVPFSFPVREEYRVYFQCSITVALTEKARTVLNEMLSRSTSEPQAKQQAQKNFTHGLPPALSRSGYRNAQLSNAYEWRQAHLFFSQSFRAKNEPSGDMRVGWLDGKFRFSSICGGDWEREAPFPNCRLYRHAQVKKPAFLSLSYPRKLSHSFTAVRYPRASQDMVDSPT